MEVGSSEYFKNVLKEIYCLRKEASDIEIMRLNFDSLEPKSKFFCIYGQMTGHCDSDRAIKLIQSCSNSNYSFAVIDSRIVTERSPRGVMGRFSFLEHCIVNFPTNNKNIISYLKGETDKLELKQVSN